MKSHERLERDWASINGLDPAGMVACASGTAALHLALEAMELPLGSQVIVPDYTMVACARAVAMSGLDPVFIDCRDDLLIDPTLLNYPWRLAPRQGEGSIRAVMPVHIYGRRCDMDAIAGWCNQWDNPPEIIEDLAEAHGIKPHSQTAAACWSFYQNKIVGGEEGGAVWFRDPKRAELARKLRCLGFTDAHDFDHIPRGHNYRMSSAHASLILPRIGSLHYYINQRRGREERINTLCPAEWRMPRRDVPWVYDFRIPGMSKGQQDRIVRRLNESGISARHGFRPTSFQREFRKQLVIGSGTAARAATEVIYLPLNSYVDPGLAFDIVAHGLRE